LRMGLAPESHPSMVVSAEDRSDTTTGPTWLNKPPTDLAAGGHWVQSVSQPSRSPLEVETDNRFARGRLIHRLLQILPDLPPERREAAAIRLSQREGFGDAEADAVLAVLGNPDYAHFFANPGLAEVPIIAKDMDGRSIAGRIDRLLIRDRDVLILDYKSDAEAPASPDTVNPAYLEQLASYRLTLGHIYSGKAIRAALLWTRIPVLMEIPAPLLDKAAMRLPQHHEAVQKP